MAGVLKKTTGLTGLAVERNPRMQLQIVYEKLRRLAKLLPSDYTYRRSIEYLVKERSEIIRESEDVATIEQKIGQGQVEELLVHANNEISLMQIVLNEKPWEKLMQESPPHQWTWPPHK